MSKLKEFSKKYCVLCRVLKWFKKQVKAVFGDNKLTDEDFNQYNFKPVKGSKGATKKFTREGFVLKWDPYIDIVSIRNVDNNTLRFLGTIESPKELRKLIKRMFVD